MLITSVSLTIVCFSLLVGATLSSSTADVASVSTGTLNESVEEAAATLNLLVFVNSSVYGGVKQSLEQYKMDLENFGFESVIVLNWSENNPLRVRETLQQNYLNGSLAGALLVGDLPAAEYEMFTEWDYERFPTDLYYTDLDGNWTDADGDGIFDRHTGKVSPEIWVGRIKVSGLGVDEITLINNYFEKSHRYREGTLTAPRRALLYVDDDWADHTSMDSYSLGLLYDNVTAVTDRAGTNADDYRNRLSQGYEWVHVRSHGSWSWHRFQAPGSDSGLIRSEEYADIDPWTLFYQFFVCSAARFTEPNYLAGEAVFRTTNGLMAIGSTKMGGMLMFWTFYEALARGRTLGDAFKEWFVKWGEGKVGLSDTYIGRKWSYGLSMIGDPTLRLRWLGEKEIAELQKYEEEVIDDLPLVQDLLEQVSSSQANYSALYDDYSELSDLYNDQRSSNDSLEDALGDIRTSLYFLLVITAGLVVSNVYLIDSKSKLKSPNYE